MSDEDVFIDEAAEVPKEVFEELKSEGKRLGTISVVDPWKHRSEGMKCKTCMYFVPKVSDNEAGSTLKLKTVIGRCRRHAPTMNGYPVVFDHDWCGDHKLNENAI